MDKGIPGRGVSKTREKNSRKDYRGNNSCELIEVQNLFLFSSARVENLIIHEAMGRTPQKGLDLVVGKISSGLISSRDLPNKADKQDPK